LGILRRALASQLAVSHPRSATGRTAANDAESGADHELVRAFLARDAAAASRLSERLQIVPRIVGGLVRRYGLPLTNDELSDVAQDAVAIALKRLPQLGPDTPLDAWLHCLCSFELRNAVRRKRRQLPGTAADVPSGETSALERLARQELVLLALERVEGDEAVAVRLHHLEGLTFAEIAARLGVSANVVKGRYYRAVSQLSVSMRSHAPTRNLP
jgi:RNA polymerase sigma factor (sigma-70 family)